MRVVCQLSVVRCQSSVVGAATSRRRSEMFIASTHSVLLHSGGVPCLEQRHSKLTSLC